MFGDRAARRRRIEPFIPSLVVVSIVAADFGAFARAPIWPYAIFVGVLATLKVLYGFRRPQLPPLSPGERRWIRVDRRPIPPLTIILMMSLGLSFFLIWSRPPYGTILVFAGMLLGPWTEDQQRKRSETGAA